MPFKVKDLMIDVTSQGHTYTACQPTYLCRIGCTAITQTACQLQCSIIHTIHPCGLIYATVFPTQTACGFGGTQVCFATCLGSETPWNLGLQGDPALGVQQAGSLKEQLKAALQAAEAQEKATEEGLKPQSVADVEMLEKKLNEALDELKVRKTELQKKPVK
jgi:hypothetical protein